MQRHRQFQREIRKFMDEYVYPDAQVRITGHPSGHFVCN